MPNQAEIKSEVELHGPKAHEPRSHENEEPERSEPQPKLGFVGSILYGGSKVLDSGWGGAAKFVGAFKGLDQARAMIAVLAVIMILGAMGATTAVGVMGYVSYQVSNNNHGSSNEATAALLKLMNEQDDKRVLERDRDHERLLRFEERRVMESERNREQIARLAREIEVVGKTNEKIAFVLERLSVKFPDPTAPMPRTKPAESDGVTESKLP